MDGWHRPLSKKVMRIAPPLTITLEEAKDAMAIVENAAIRMT
jgi:4-aminobutyrate aminotransferase-like enzyme